MGIEPTQPAWKAGVLPLNYTRLPNLYRNRLLRNKPPLHLDDGHTMVEGVGFEPT